MAEFRYYPYYKKDGKTYRLTEEKQVFKDGRERRRNFKGAVQEKMKAGENPKEAMIRGIWEELGITDSIELEEQEKTEETLDSPSYPGIRSRYIRHNFKGTLSEEQFNLDGYIEEQEDKSTYFVWEEV